MRRDPEVARVIAEIEAAAAAARLSTNGNAESGATSGTQSGYRQKERVETYDDLPEIPVYRNSKIEIYRRDRSGILAKVEERKPMLARPTTSAQCQVDRRSQSISTMVILSSLLYLAVDLPKGGIIRFEFDGLLDRP